MSGTRPNARAASGLEVSEAEAGMKLLRFLERRLGETVPRPALYKWIRTGQVRVNGGRAGPHVELARADIVRVPPFAALRPVADEAAFDRAGAEVPGGADHVPDLGPGLTLMAQAGDVLVLNKAAGLASQPGGGDSVAARLAKAFRGCAYVPSPAHRLDRLTSGLLVAGLSHAGQRALHALVKDGGMVKEYLAWVYGRVDFGRPRLLEDVLFTAREGQKELVAARPDNAAEREPGEPGAYGIGHEDGERGNRRGDGGSFAVCAALTVARLGPGELPPELTGERTGAQRHAGRVAEQEGASLLLVRLFTGRKHQIRVQFASRGRPIIGDGRYGGPHYTRMLLHAWRLSFSAPAQGAVFPSPPLPVKDATAPCLPGGRLSFSAPPDWPQPFIPDAAALAAAAERMRAVLG